MTELKALMNDIIREMDYKSINMTDENFSKLKGYLRLATQFERDLQKIYRKQTGKYFTV